MSWKGLQKAISRLPHQLMLKRDEATRDEEFINLENKFNESIKKTNQLKIEAQAFRNSILAILTHQTEIANSISLVYSNFDKTNEIQSTAIQAANDAEAAMAYCQEEILPSLNTMDAVIIYPLSDLQELVKHIQKTITKRNHKLIDYDRYRLHLAKLQAKTEKTLNEEKSLLKVQAQHEIATQDYEYLNNLLKEQLPDFLILLKTLMESIFQSLYQLQEQIYRMIYARCDELVRANETHFVTYAMSVDEGYQWKKSQFDTPTEIQNMDIFKSGGKVGLTSSGGENKLSLQERASLKQQKIYGQHPSSLKPSYDIKQPSNIQQQSAVTPITVPIPVAHTSVINKSVSSSSIQYVLALYDYEAQAEGDLSFKKDDKIELIQRTSDTNDWWTGKLKGIIGIFPGTYVSII